MISNEWICNVKKILLASVALFGLTAAASAADLPSRVAPAPVAVVPVFTWTGFYVGAQAGYAWGDSDSRLFVGGVDVTAAAFPDGTDYDTDGFVGGVHAGYNVQFGSFVVGVEGDIEAASIDGDRSFTDLGVAASTDIDFQGSLRARAGVAFDRALLYVTGGLAFANIENTYTDIGTGDSVSFDDTEWGWTLGAGVEYAVTNNLSVRGEYRYTKFDDVENVIDGLGTVEQDSDFHTVRVGVSYKFGTY